MMVLERALQSEDVGTALRQVHELKSTFGIIGAKNALAICSRILEGDAAVLKEEGPQLSGEWREVERELQNLN
jgi:HPt (histidine-containing phosphotransfer) domain-containing protein